MKLVSVIVPVYNVEKYLDQCINSIINQTYRDLEIILINDGSTDKSGDICDRYVNQDNRIMVVHKKNAGLGYARNTGLLNVSGYYLIFVDSDDWLAENAVETWVYNAEKYNADMVICGFNKFMNVNKITINRPVSELKLYKGKEKIIKRVLYPMIGSDAMRRGSDEHEMCVWTNLYRTQIIKENNIRFLSEREYLSEDFFYNVEYLMNTNIVAYIPDCLYYYRFNNVSLSNGFRPNKIQLLNKMTQVATLVLKDHGILDGAGYRLERAYIKRLRKALLLIDLAKVLSLRDKVIRYREAVNDTYTQKLVKDYPLDKVPIREAILVCLIKHRRYMVLFLFLRIQRILLRIMKRL